jgi:hypothetical protein
MSKTWQMANGKKHTHRAFLKAPQNYEWIAAGYDQLDNHH